VALAYSQSGLLPGIIYHSADSEIDPSINPVGSNDSLTGLHSGDRGSTEGAVVVNGTDPRNASRGDALALVQADRLAGIAAMVSSWFSPRRGTGPELGPASLESWRPTLLAEAGSDPNGKPLAQPGDGKTDRIEHAELGVPTTLVVVSAAAYRLRQLAARWWRRSPNRKGLFAQRGTSGLGPGPRSFRKTSGETKSHRHSYRR
jgi:hypothetical protein